jgi:hypothetical protein
VAQQDVDRLGEGVVYVAEVAGTVPRLEELIDSREERVAVELGLDHSCRSMIAARC